MNAILIGLICDDEEFRRQHQRKMRRELRLSAPNLMNMSDNEFQRNFRLNKLAFRYVLEELRSEMEPIVRSSSLSLESKLAACLRFLAEGAYQRGAAQDFHVAMSQSAFSNHLNTILGILEGKLCPKWIKLSMNEQEKQEAKRYFYEKSGIPGVVMCVDGTHIKVFKPSENAHLFYNRKGFFSQNAMIICDHNMKIRYINAKHPGASHDSYIWNCSDASAFFENAYQSGDRNSRLLVKSSEDEERLVRDLFRGYNKLIRPVQNMTQKVDVRFGLAFVQLINVNEKNQIMKSNVWLRLVWSDYQLQWDEADYGGIGVLRLPPDKVWKPDIVLFNNADGNYEVRYKSNVLIYPNGEVLWVPPAIYQSSCTIDVTYFPFDQQTCIMKFGSWTFNGDQVSLALYNNKNFVDLSDYWKSGTWDIIEVPAYLNINEGNHPTETDITFYITIRRKTLFYTVNLILPTVLISFLCVLVFYLPAEAGEKVTLGISILLSLVVFLLLVSKILPPTSLVLPLIAKYLLFTFIMNTVSILVTVVIINWNFRGPRTHRMPAWIRSVFLHYLPAFLLMKRPRKTRLRWMMEMPEVSVQSHTQPAYGLPAELPKHISGAIGGKAPKMEVMELSDLHHPNCKINRKMEHGSDLGGVSDPCRRESESSDSILLSPEASKATEAVEFIAEHLRNEDLYIQTREDWKYVAMVIDRLQLYIFFLITTAGTVGILMDAPHIFEYVDQDRIIEIYRGK